MKQTLASWRTLAASAAALLLVGAGCGGSGDTTAPASDGSKTAAPAGQKLELTGAMIKATYFDAETEISVKNVTTNFMSADITAPDAGKQYVRLELSVKNTGKEKFTVNPVSYRLKTSSKELVDYAWVLEPSLTDFLEDKELAAGEAVSGALYYEVPSGETLDTLSLVYEGAVAKDGATDKKEYEIPLKK